MFENPDIEFAPKILAGLHLVSTPTATHYLLTRGYKNVYMIDIPPQALGNGQVMVGRARTLRFLPLREDLIKQQYAEEHDGQRPHLDAIESIRPGEVLVVDACSCTKAGVVGDMYTRRVLELGGKGIVIDGCARDLSTIRQIGLPLFCRGTYGAGVSRALMSVDYQVPIHVGGVPVLPGDLLLGDADGIVVVFLSEVENLAAYGIEHEVCERFTRSKLEEGYSMSEAYPPRGPMRAAYLEWRKSQPEYAQYPFAFKED